MEIGDGRATVSGYKLPKSHCAARRGKAGARSETRSQDIDWRLLIVSAGHALADDFSAKEKDEASPAVSADGESSLSAFILCFGGTDDGAFPFSGRAPSPAPTGLAQVMVRQRQDGRVADQSNEITEHRIRDPYR